jgi:hypothetical protein
LMPGMRSGRPSAPRCTHASSNVHVACIHSLCCPAPPTYAALTSKKTCHITTTAALPHRPRTR